MLFNALSQKGPWAERGGSGSCSARVVPDATGVGYDAYLKVPSAAKESLLGEANEQVGIK